MMRRVTSSVKDWFVWLRRSSSPGGFFAVLGYVVLVIGLMFALWQIKQTQDDTAIRICQEQNEMRQELIDVFEGQLPPVEVPDHASTELERIVQQTNERDRRLVQTFIREMRPLDCEEN